MLSLLHPDPDCRPSVDAIVRSELLLALHKSIRQRKHAPGVLSHSLYNVSNWAIQFAQQALSSD